MFWAIQKFELHRVRLQQPPTRTTATARGDTNEEDMQGAIVDLLDMLVVSRDCCEVQVVAQLELHAKLRKANK
jgi:hypothetical protein